MSKIKIISDNNSKSKNIKKILKKNLVEKRLLSQM